MSNGHHLTLSAADHRRAAALVAHHARDDLDGVNAVFAETQEVQRSTELVIALLDLYQQLVPAVHTPLGIEFLSGYLHKVAGMEDS